MAGENQPDRKSSSAIAAALRWQAEAKTILPEHTLMLAAADEIERLHKNSAAEGDLRELVEWTIKLVADEAWGIAARADCPPEVALAIEALSDNPEVCAKLTRWALNGKRDEG